MDCEHTNVYIDGSGALAAFAPVPIELDESDHDREDDSEVGGNVQGWVAGPQTISTAARARTTPHDHANVFICTKLAVGAAKRAPFPLDTSARPCRVACMTANTETYAMTLTRGQAEYLLYLVSIGELAMAEHNRTSWLPGGAGDATLMTRYLQAIRGAPSLEQPMRELGAWVRKRD